MISPMSARPRHCKTFQHWFAWFRVGNTYNFLHLVKPGCKNLSSRISGYREHVWNAKKFPRSLGYQMKNTYLLWYSISCWSWRPIGLGAPPRKRRPGRTRIQHTKLFLHRFIHPSHATLPIHHALNPTSVRSSVAVLAEISLRSPRKLFIFIPKKIIYSIKVSKK